MYNSQLLHRTLLGLISRINLTISKTVVPLNPEILEKRMKNCIRWAINCIE